MPRGPIFIGGAERSGTSLLYALLTSHPNISMTRRTNLWAYFYNQYGDLSHPQNLERCLGSAQPVQPFPGPQAGYRRDLARILAGAAQLRAAVRNYWPAVRPACRENPLG